MIQAIHFLSKYKYDLLFFILSLIQLVLCPWTKVEESFNVQAAPDILYRLPLAEYDHLEFSGVVPRTFIGPLILSIFSYPAVIVFQALNLKKIYALYAIRIVLSALYSLSFAYFRHSVAQLFKSRHVAKYLSLITLAQFHLLFYSSRPLANVFASIGVNLALAFYCKALAGKFYNPQNSAEINKNAVKMVQVLSLVCIIFRCDMLILAFCLISAVFYHKLFSLQQFLVGGLISSVLGVVLTVAIDSLFWGKLLWPELSVALYNNPSDSRFNSWGISPWHYYFSNFLPRALLVAFPLAILAIFRAFPTPSTLRTAGSFNFFTQFDGLVGSLLLPAVMFVAIYSFITHKELRFIFPAIPAFNAAAAVALHKISTLKPSKINNLVHVLAVFGVFCSFAASLAFLYMSSWNYPGGFAVEQFHSQHFSAKGSSLHLRKEFPTSFQEICSNLRGENHSLHSRTALEIAQKGQNSSGKKLVHVDNLACISGFTRFHEENQYFLYSKQENIGQNELQNFPFDFLINSRREMAGFSQWPGESEGDHESSGFQRIDLMQKRVVIEPVLFSFQRNK
jgi:alpha-1,6-mannosyltransferase